MVINNGATFHIDDEDYDSGISMQPALDTNLGTVLSLSGYANTQQEHTYYKTILRGIGTPNSDYDAANKKYVDDHTTPPNYYLVELNFNGSVKNYSSLLNYNTIQANLTNPLRSDALDIMWPNDEPGNTFTRFHAPCIGIREVNNGDLIFTNIIYYLGVNMLMVFALNSNNVLSTLVSLPMETLENKKQSVIANSTSTQYYPSTKAVYDEFQRKPVVIWETSDTSQMLTGLDTDMTANPNWQLTNLDFSPYSYVKIYTRSAQKTGATANASTTPAIVLEMTLDSRAVCPFGGHYLGSTMIQKSNDANRMATLTCAISADKTSFAVMRMTNLYGTAATSNSDVGAGVFKIVGYYD